MVEHILLKTIERHGLTIIPTEGEPMLVYHEVVREVEGEEKDAGTIANVVKRGYTLNGKVLRPAKVAPLTMSAHIRSLFISQRR